jgi:hypothetical protein
MATGTFALMMTRPSRSRNQRENLGSSLGKSLRKLTLFQQNERVDLPTRVKNFLLLFETDPQVVSPYNLKKCVGKVEERIFFDQPGTEQFCFAESFRLHER